MGQAVSGGGSQKLSLKSEKINAIVVDDVKVRVRTYEVKVPVIKKVDTIQYVKKEEETVKYNVVEKVTDRYHVQEKETIKYTPRTEDTIKYVPKEVEVEKPIVYERPYEKPIIVKKEVEVVTYKNLDAIKALSTYAKVLTNQVDELKDKIKKLESVKIVEKVITVPEIRYVPTKVERIIWQDVPRERCSVCKKVV